MLYLLAGIACLALGVIIISYAFEGEDIDALNIPRYWKSALNGIIYLLGVFLVGFGVFAVSVALSVLITL